MIKIEKAKCGVAGSLSKVAISQRFLPHYRVLFFDQLKEALDEQGCSLRLFYSYTMGDLDRQPNWARRLWAFRVNLKLAELEDSAILAPGWLWHLVRYAPDVVVLEDLGGILNSLTGSLYCRLWRKPYLIWGLGNVPQKRRSRLRRLLSPLIRFLYGGAFGFICYSTHASAIYSQYGKPTYLAPNSSVPKPTPTEVARVGQEISNRSGGDCIRVISIGALKRQKRYDVLIRSLAQMPSKVILDLVGDGPEMSCLKELAKTLGLAERVVFHGPLYDRAKKSQLLFSAHIGVMPGRGGLAIQEMMRHGVPVISGVADGTERDLIRDGHSGYLIDGFPSPEQISGRVRDFIALTSAQQTDMARAALEVVVHVANTGTMAQGMVAAVKSALGGMNAGYPQQCVE